MNFLKETLKILNANGKHENDVQFVLNENSWCSFNEFKKFADFEYDRGYGTAEINSSLFIVGSDWWLERGEYDGSEWWEFKTIPTKFNLPHKSPTDINDFLTYYFKRNLDNDT